MTRLRAVLAVFGVILGLGLLAAVPAEAGSGNDRAIRDLRTLRTVDKLVVVDVGAQHDRWIYAKRAQESRLPLTPLQVAIMNNRALVETINRTVWSFDLKSVYAALIQGNTVYLYLDEPPPY
jgi:hypothetical protein